MGWQQLITGGVDDCYACMMNYAQASNCVMNLTMVCCAAVANASCLLGGNANSGVHQFLRSVVLGSGCGTILVAW
jgi:hypothetical protein